MQWKITEQEALHPNSALPRWNVHMNFHINDINNSTSITAKSQCISAKGRMIE